MSVPEVSRRAGPFEGNGSAKEFAFHFKVFTSDQIAVYVSAPDGSDVLVESGYSVELNEDQEALPGGTVYLVDALPEGRRLTLLSNVPYDQPMVLTNQGGFYPGTVNNGVDRLEIQIQQLLEKIGRAILVPATSDLSADEILKRLLETYDLAQQVVAIADEIRALGPVADDIAALGPHAEAIARISEKLDDLLKIDGIISAIEEIEENTEKAQNAADSAQAAADRAEDLLGDLEGVFDENQALADLTDSYLLLLASTASTASREITKRDIEHYYRWEREGLALLEAVGTLALTRATETQNEIDHWNMWYEDGLNRLRLTGTVALYAASTTENDCEHFVAWFKKGEEEETNLLAKLSETAQETKQVIETIISVFDDDMRTRNLLIRTYVEKPPVLWIVAGQSNAVGYARPPYEAAKYCGQFWDWTTGVNALKPLKDPLNAWYPNYGSAWPSFARTFFELTGRKVAMLSVARGGSAVTKYSSNTWYGEDAENTLRVNASTQYAAMTAALGTVNEDYVLGGMLWIQGEAECGGVGNGTISVNEYVMGTEDVFRFFRALTSKSDLPIFMSQIGYTSSVRTNAALLSGYQQIQAAQTDYCRTHENVYMAFEGAKYFLDAREMTDTIHYSQKGYNIVGDAFARCAANTLTF